MLDLETQTQFADATAAMLRSCAMAATDALTRSATQGMSVWSQMLLAANPASTSGWRHAASPDPFGLFAPLSSSAWAAMAGTSQWSAWPWRMSQMGVPGWMSLAPQAWAGPGMKAWIPLTDWSSAWSRSVWPGWGPGSGPGWGKGLEFAPPARQLAAPRPAAVQDPDSSYSSYRSAGGHATAQVVMASSPAAITNLAATMTLAPMQTMLDIWRSVLRL